MVKLVKAYLPLEGKHGWVCRVGQYCAEVKKVGARYWATAYRYLDAKNRVKCFTFPPSTRLADIKAMIANNSLFCVVEEMKIPKCGVPSGGTANRSVASGGAGGTVLAYGGATSYGGAPSRTYYWQYLEDREYGEG